MDSVIDFYKTNADSFSKTRVSPWPATKNFLDSLPKDSKLLDLGCGNGRNMFYRNDLKTTGFELSQELCDIVSKKGGNIIKGNIIDLPFDDESFDTILCIAVYHHLDNTEDRKKAINEIHRVLKKGGKCFIQVWAMEQPFESRRKFTKRDEYVSWNDNGVKKLRYYRIYPKGELEEEIIKFKPEFRVKDVLYEQGNWINLIIK